MKVTVVGGGIIGLCSAYYLTKSGFEVQVVDKGDFSNNCSHGNAGFICPSHVIPLATRGIIKQGIKWMFKKSSPFYFKPRLNADLVAWSWRFFRSSNPQQVQEAIPVLNAFGQLSQQLFSDMISAEDFKVSLKNQGLLMLYKTAAAEAEEAEVAEKVHNAGLEVRKLSGLELSKLDPQTKYDVRGAIYYPNDAHINPSQLLDELRKFLTSNGVRFIANFNITDFEIKNNRVTSIQSEDKTIAVDHLVAAAGAQTAQLLKTTGIRLLLQDGKGYSFTINKPAHCPSIPAILLEDRVAVTPLENHLRIGGTMEISGLDRQIKMHKVLKINEAFKSYYPKTNSGDVLEKDVWYGFRPCSIDGLPYIGNFDRLENLTVATGHAMLGLSLGAATGKLVSEIILNVKPSLDLSPFDPQR